MTGQLFSNREGCDHELIRNVWKHAVISACSAAVFSLVMSHSPAVFLQTILFLAFPLGLFTDAVRLRLKLGRMHSLMTKLGLYAAVFFFLSNAQAGSLAALFAYFLIECAISLMTRSRNTAVPPDSSPKPYEDGAERGR
ncbi:transporter [Bacillus nakamurai]|uniref:transporter n=1 Tax=Bacillus nakamurai TaxID=1793963 RepID=UPI0020C4F7A7|nr:transporter [Bacillus nakamurai]MCP6682407.1 transporter [Bacillus nakamurai]